MRIKSQVKNYFFFVNWCPVLWIHFAVDSLYYLGKYGLIVLSNEGCFTFITHDLCMIDYNMTSFSPKECKKVHDNIAIH